MAKKNNLDEFVEFLGHYAHHPDVDTGCEFGDHWHCTCQWTGYSFQEYIDHIVEAFRA